VIKAAAIATMHTKGKFHSTAVVYMRLIKDEVSATAVIKHNNAKIAAKTRATRLQ
jgi:hypothetical protein